MASQLSEILDRLKLMHDDIITSLGSGTAYRTPPLVFAGSTLPMVYCVPGGFSEQRSSYTNVIRSYTFQVHWLVAPVYQNIDDSAVSKLITDTEDLIEIAETYYDNHRSLSTNSLGNIARIYHSGMGVACDGAITFFPLLQETEYAGTMFNLTVPVGLDVKD